MAVPTFAQRSKKKKQAKGPELPVYTARLIGEPQNDSMKYSYEIKNDLIIIHYIYPGLCDKMFENIYFNNVYTEAEKKEQIDKIEEVASNINYKIYPPNFLLPYPAVPRNGTEGTPLPPDPPETPVVYFIGGPEHPQGSQNCLKNLIFTDEDQMETAKYYFARQVIDPVAEATLITNQESQLGYERDKTLTTQQRLARAIASLIVAVDRREHPEKYPKPEPKQKNIPASNDTIPAAVIPQTTQN